MRSTDIAKRLLVAFGPVRFVLFGAVPEMSRIMLNDAGGQCTNGFDEADDATCLVCVDLNDDALLKVLSDDAARRCGSIYIQHQSSASVQTREALENRGFELGYRKHASYHKILGYAELEQNSSTLVTLLEPLGAEALKRFSLADLSEERDLHMDMLREAGRRSDAHVVRYDWASQFIRPNDTVLDAACGLGYGSHVMRHLSRGRKFIGIDGSDSAVEYARICFGSETVEYRTGLLPDALSCFDDASFDVVVSFETLEHVVDPVGLLAEFKRVLRPGGRIIASVPNDWSDASGEDPNPHHLHVYTWERLADELSAGFLMESTARQIASGCKRLDAACEWVERPRVLETVDLSAAESGLEAEWWLCVGMKSPLDGAHVPYVETVHDAFEGNSHLIDFDTHYGNPWLAHAMVEIPYRLKNQAELKKLAEEIAQTQPKDSADYGAALAVLSYQTLSDATSPLYLIALEDQIRDYLRVASDNPHVARWKVSLAYVSARLKLRRGARRLAADAFMIVARSDIATITPTLGTKVVDAAYWAGLLLWLEGAAVDASAWWKEGLRLAEAQLGVDWLEFYGNPSTPFGFSMNDAVEIMDRAAACAQALSLTARPGPAVHAELQALAANALRSAVRRLSDDVRECREDAAHLQRETHRLCGELLGLEGQNRLLESLAVQRLDQIRTLEQRLAQTDAAFRYAENLAFKRQAEWQPLETLALQRLDRVHALEKRSSELESLAIQRLDRIHVLEERLKSTDTAFRFAEKLALERQEERQTLEATALERLEKIRSLESELRETDCAFRRAEKLAFDRQAELDSLGMSARS